MPSSAALRITIVGPTANFIPSTNARHQHAAQELGVHADGLQRGPEAASRHGAVRAGCDAQALVLELRGDDAQHIRSHADVAVAHHQQVVAGLGHHAVQLVDLGVGIGRLARQQDADRDRRVLPAQALDGAEGGIILSPDREQQLEVRIVLLEETAQVLFEVLSPPRTAASGC